jgi:hypothetical protein
MLFKQVFNMQISNNNNWLYPFELVDWAKANLNIVKLDEDLMDTEICEIIKWIGMCSVDTIYIDGDKPILGRIGIGLMLSVTLLEFPDYYMKYELSQFN